MKAATEAKSKAALLPRWRQRGPRSQGGRPTAGLRLGVRPFGLHQSHGKAPLNGSALVLGCAAGRIAMLLLTASLIAAGSRRVVLPLLAVAGWVVALLGLPAALVLALGVVVVGVLVLAWRVVAGH